MQDATYQVLHKCRIMLPELQFPTPYHILRHSPTHPPCHPLNFTFSEPAPTAALCSPLVSANAAAAPHCASPVYRKAAKGCQHVDSRGRGVI
jgi:hypothetical protein